MDRTSVCSKVSPNAPITAEQIAGLENRMDAGGMPVVSGTNAPGLVRAMDNMGNIQFANPEQANAMNATMGETIRAEKEAQQKAINSDYMRGAWKRGYTQHAS